MAEQLKIFIEKVKKFCGSLGDLFNTNNKKVTSPIYRLTDWIKGKIPGEDKVKIQIIGTRNEITVKPKDIIYDDDIICGFSPLDVKTIAMLALSLRKQPKYEIVINEFRNALNEEIITIKENGKPELIRKSIQELSNNLDMIDGFSPIDAYNLGRTKGEIEATEHYQMLKELK